MSPSKPLKIIIGVLTALVVVAPIFLVAISLGVSFLLPASQVLSPRAPQPEFFAVFTALIPLLIIPAMFCFSILRLGLQVLYVVLIVKDRQLNDTPRILYTLGVYFLPYLAMPLYYILNFWKDAPQTALAEAG